MQKDRGYIALKRKPSCSGILPAAQEVRIVVVLKLVAKRPMIVRLTCVLSGLFLALQLLSL